MLSFLPYDITFSILCNFKPVLLSPDITVLILGTFALARCFGRYIDELNSEPKKIHCQLSLVNPIKKATMALTNC